MAFAFYWDVTALNVTITIITITIITIIIIVIISNMTASGKTLRAIITSGPRPRNGPASHFLPNEILIIIINALIDDVLDEASEDPIDWIFTTNTDFHEQLLVSSGQYALSSVLHRQALLDDVAFVNHSCRHLVTRRFTQLPLLHRTSNHTELLIRAWVCPEFDTFDPMLEHPMPPKYQNLLTQNFLGAIRNLQIIPTTETCHLLKLLGAGMIGLPNLKCLILRNRKEVLLPIFGPPEKPFKTRPLRDDNADHREICYHFGHRTGVALLEPLWSRGVRILIKSSTLLPNNQPHEELVRISRGQVGVKYLDCAYKYSNSEPYSS